MPYWINTYVVYEYSKILILSKYVVQQLAKETYK
jgi:hypothetical protein